MTELTREEWGEVAQKLGEEADRYDDFIQEVEKTTPEGALDKVRGMAHALRMGVAAVLWVSENAAEKIRFEMLDGHPPDEE